MYGNSIMRFEIVFMGTLSQFINEVRDLQENILEDSGYALFKRGGYEYHYTPGGLGARVSFWNPDDEDAAKTGYIKAISRPGEKTILQGGASDEHWEELKPCWERLEDVMRRHGFIEGAEVDNHSGFFPKSEEKRFEYARILILMKDLEEQYRLDYEEYYTRDDPEPEPDDYRDFIAAETGKKPSPSKLRDVKRAWKEGRLNTYMEELAKPQR